MMASLPSYFALSFLVIVKSFIKSNFTVIVCIGKILSSDYLFRITRYFVVRIRKLIILMYGVSAILAMIYLNKSGKTPKNVLNTS